MSIYLQIITLNGHLMSIQECFMNNYVIYQDVQLVTQRSKVGELALCPMVQFHFFVILFDSNNKLAS